MPAAGCDYPSSYAELLDWFPDDAACLDYLAALARGDALPALRPPGGVAVGRRSVGVRALWTTGIGDRGNDLPPHAHATAAVVRRRVG